MVGMHASAACCASQPFLYWLRKYLGRKVGQLAAAIIEFVACVVSLAAIRSKDFARAAPGGQEGPPDMRRPGRAGTQAGSGRVAATTTVAAARAADRPGLPTAPAAGIHDLTWPGP